MVASTGVDPFPVVTEFDVAEAVELGLVDEHVVDVPAKLVPTLVEESGSTFVAHFDVEEVVVDADKAELLPGASEPSGVVRPAVASVREADVEIAGDDHLPGGQDVLPRGQCVDDTRGVGCSAGVGWATPDPENVRPSRDASGDGPPALAGSGL